MAKYKSYSYEQSVLIPVDYAQQILPGTFEHTLNYLIDNRVDLSIFEKRYKNDLTGAPAWDPAIMLKIVIFAYSKGIISSRDIADACKTNVIFKALSANSEPHFTTIASFISTMKEEILPIFSNILLVCSELELIGGNMFAIDGCKINSNAAKEWSGTFKDLAKKKDKFDKTAKFLMEKHKLNDNSENKESQSREKALKQVEKIKKKAEKIERFLLENEEKMGKRGRESQSNITDNESAKMKTSKGVVQGYNGLAFTDSKNQIVVYAEAFGSGQEVDLLKPMVEGTKQIIEDIGQVPDYLKNKKLLADTNYFSEDNLRYLAEEEIDSIIPDQQFRQRDPRFATQAQHKPEKTKIHQSDFTYDQENNVYVCPKGKRLEFSRYAKLGNTSGRRYEAKQKDCTDCNLKEKCLKTKKTKRRTLYIKDRIEKINHSEQMMRKIDTEEGKAIYSKRMGIVEPVFSNITYCKRMNRFTLRTKAKVNIQWLLFCMVHNIGKIASVRSMEA